MNRYIMSALVFSLFMVFQSGTASAQELYLLDIGKVFKLHTRFNQQMELMKKEVEGYKAKMQRDQQGLQLQAEKLKTLPSDSVEFKTLESQLARAAADMQVDQQLKSKEFAVREAQLYYETYVDVSNKVARFCQANNISIVMRYNSEIANSTNTDRPSVLQKVNGSVVYQKSRDLTDYIVKQVVTQAAANRQPASGNGLQR